MRVCVCLVPMAAAAETEPEEEEEGEEEDFLEALLENRGLRSRLRKLSKGRDPVQGATDFEQACRDVLEDCSPHHSPAAAKAVLEEAIALLEDAAKLGHNATTLGCDSWEEADVINSMFEALGFRTDLFQKDRKNFVRLTWHNRPLLGLSAMLQ